MTVNKRSKRIIQDLRQSLVEMISGSEEISEQLRRIQEEGYTLQLVLDRQEDVGERRVRIEIPNSTGSSQEARYRLGKDDVSLLSELGIDATRAGKRRRGQQGIAGSLPRLRHDKPSSSS